ncbi:MAG TPA: serine hydrolase domain-containing protein, partial [Kofleriaceae bacterium]|nr:serine hydrolase domain-containing protein [Kofleriaceae bacterium]
ATRISVILREQGSDQEARATMEVDAAEPHRVVRFAIAPLPFQRMSEADAIAALRAELAEAVAKDRFAGAVLVAKNGVPIFAEAFGLADREQHIANTLDTRFRIGSMNKMFTAVATLQLVQAKQLELGTSVGKVLRGYPNAGVASKVTVHHLLTHSGGTGDIFGPEFDAHRLELKTIGDYVKLYGHRDLEFEPGSKWQYSNYGFILLGAILEKVSKQSYYDRVSASVYKPAGMTATASPPEARPDATRAVPYTRENAEQPWASAVDTLPYRGTSAGGGDSTVGDLLRFANALTANKLLDAAHTALLTTGKLDTPSGARYAYGFEDATSDGVRCFGHSGGAPGMNGMLRICDSGYTIAVLANLDPPAAGRVAKFIQHRLPAK